MCYLVVMDRFACLDDGKADAVEMPDKKQQQLLTMDAKSPGIHTK